MRLAAGMSIVALAAAIAGCATPSANLGAQPTSVATAVASESETTDERVLPSFKMPAPGTPLISIVIDDCGESLEQVVPFLGIPVPLTFSILPYHPGVRETVRVLHGQGKEMIVHVPMEPNNPRWLENDWFLRTGMGAADIRERLGRALDAVPGATGMNNHMGSKFCSDENAMTVVMQVAADNGMYYLDSRTTAGTAAPSAANAAGTRLIARDVFLDNDDDVERITARLEELVETAKKNGCAVGIGHARTKTALAIMNFVRDRDHGVAFVPAGYLAGRCHDVPVDPSDQCQIPPE